MKSDRYKLKRWQSVARNRSLQAIAASAVLGALVWGSSPIITGQDEPWDANLAYYGLGIALASFIGGRIVRPQIWQAMLGAYIGQVLYCWLLYHPSGPIILPITISAAVFGFIPSFFGALVGARATPLAWLRTIRPPPS